MRGGGLRDPAAALGQIVAHGALGWAGGQEDLLPEGQGARETVEGDSVLRLDGISRPTALQHGRGMA
ncbi:hypothetical protein FGW37_31000 [Streptomyces rectiverticillatus]|uniref:hypothetical protein n=1 Tax=Streptomyces rectiverticillatus TaxID=173860 RepID=UPI0015C30841|nr:hypothetical protein [Streptomyces rectiverticillatus]QLE75424.1 hypothetical protein FGW37_31000 [Streptomyces rectiverticillatus]